MERALTRRFAIAEASPRRLLEDGRRRRPMPLPQAGEVDRARGPLRANQICSYGFDGVRTSGGFGLGLGGDGPGAGLTSIGGGNGATWLVSGGLGAAGAACGAFGATFGFGGARRGSRPGIGRSVKDGSGAGSGETSVGNAAVAGGGSPRSMASSRRVSRSIVRTASHDDSGARSTVRLSLSGGPAANSWISGGAPESPVMIGVRLARMSAWSAGMS